MKVKINGFEGIREFYCVYWHERDQVEVAHYLLQFKDHDDVSTRLIKEREIE